MTWIAASEVFDGQRLLNDYAIRVENDVVIALEPIKNVPTDKVMRYYEGLLSPGFFDIQVNGGGGVLFNTSPTVSGMATIARAHRRFGTIGILPTVITDSPDVLAAAVDAAIAAIGKTGIFGIHIEGPHISHGRRGTHDPAYVRPMDSITMAHVRRLRDAGLPVLITVAPESTTNRDIALLHDMGAIVSLGHSDTTAAIALDAVDSGARNFTHLFNGMSPMENRAPGVTGAAIMSNVWCSIIADGIHVDPLMLRMAARARPIADRMIAVSDAMATVGGPESFDLYGQKILLRDGRLINAEGSLAGAHLTMLEAFQNLVSYGFGREEALRMCNANPAELMGLTSRLSLMGMATSDIVVLDPQLELDSVGIFVEEALSPSH